MPTSYDISWPLDTTPSAPNAQGVDPQKARDDIYGTDLLFLDDLQVTAKGDWATVQDVENLRRAIMRRLIVKPGEYRFNPKYGVGIASYVKKPATKALLDQLRHAIVDNISQDRRVEKVLEVTVTSVIITGADGNLDTALSVVVRVQAIGRDVRFQPFTFASKEFN
jgi:phage baseplate assembly protein W